MGQSVAAWSRFMQICTSEANRPTDILYTNQMLGNVSSEIPPIAFSWRVRGRIKMTIVAFCRSLWSHSVGTVPDCYLFWEIWPASSECIHCPFFCSDLDQCTTTNYSAVKAEVFRWKRDWKYRAIKALDFSKVFFSSQWLHLLDQWIVHFYGRRTWAGML